MFFMLLCIMTYKLVTKFLYIKLKRTNQVYICHPHNKVVLIFLCWGFRTCFSVTIVTYCVQITENFQKHCHVRNLRSTRLVCHMNWLNCWNVPWSVTTTTKTKEKRKYVLKIYLTLHTDEKHNENPDADGHFEQLL